MFKTEQKTEGNISHNAATFSLLFFFQDVALADLAALNLLGSSCLQLLIGGIKGMCHRVQVSHGSLNHPGPGSDKATVEDLGDLL